MANKLSIAQKIFNSLTSRPFCEDRLVDQEECLKRIDKVLKAEKACPLYVDYRKSCLDLRHRMDELSSSRQS